MRFANCVGNKKVALTCPVGFVKIDTLYEAITRKFQRNRLRELTVTCDNMRQLTGLFITTFLFLITIAWLTASYMPKFISSLPQASFETLTAQSMSRGLAIGTLVLFLGIQFNLLQTTTHWFHSSNHSPVVEALAEFGVRRSWELLWTALPPVTTLVLLLWLSNR